MDVLRWIALAEGAFLVGFALAVVREAKKFRAPPSHIRWIVASYLLLVLSQMVEVWARLGDPYTWRISVSLFSFGFGIFATYEMYRAYRFAVRTARHARVSQEAALRLLKEAGRE